MVYISEMVHDKTFSKGFSKPFRKLSKQHLIQFCDDNFPK